MVALQWLAAPLPGLLWTMQTHSIKHLRVPTQCSQASWACRGFGSLQQQLKQINSTAPLHCISSLCSDRQRPRHHHHHQGARLAACRCKQAVHQRSAKPFPLAGCEVAMTHITTITRQTPLGQSMTSIFLLYRVRMLITQCHSMLQPDPQPAVASKVEEAHAASCTQLPVTTCMPSPAMLSIQCTCVHTVHHTAEPHYIHEPVL